jgi:hypothetical protein
MNVFGLQLHTYNPNQFFFLEPKPNIIIDGTFAKVIYTHEDFTMNGVYIHIPPENVTELVRRLETNILLQYARHTNNTKECFIGSFKKQRAPVNERTVLNISGVWENESHFGITYKWMEGSTIGK